MLSTKALVGVTAAAVFMAACGGGGSTTTTFKGTKKVGLSTALTGQSASYGASINNAVKLWQDDINGKGGAAGYKVEVVVRDDATKADSAAENTRQLILQDQVVAMLGAVTSAQCQAAMPIAHQNKIPYIAATCNDYHNTLGPKLHIPEYVSVVPNTFMEATAAGIDAAKRTSLKKWYILSPDYAFGRAETPAFVAALKKGNPDVQIVNPESKWYVPLTTFNFQTVIPQIQAAKPDAIYSNIFAATQTAFINGALQADSTFFTKYAFTTLASIDDYNALPDKYPLGIRAYERAPFFAIKTDAMKKFISDYKSKYNGYPSDWAVMAYDALSVWAKAANEAGTVDGVKVLDKMVGGSFDTLRGKVNIRKEDQQASVGMWVGSTTRDAAYPFVIMKDIVSFSGDDLMVPLSRVSAMLAGSCAGDDVNKCP